MSESILLGIIFVVGVTLGYIYGYRLIEKLFIVECTVYFNGHKFNTYCIDGQQEKYRKKLSTQLEKAANANFELVETDDS